MAEDAPSSVSAELHEMAVRHSLPSLARVRPGAAIELVRAETASAATDP